MSLKKVSWRFNLILLIVVLLSVSLLFQLFYVIPYIQSEEMDDERSHQENTAHNIAVFLSTKIDKSIEDLHVMSGDSEFFDMDPDNQSATLRRYLELVPLTSIFAMDSEGWFVSSSQADISAFQTKAYPDLDTFRIPFEEGVIYFGAPRSYFEGTQVRASFSLPVVSDSDEPIGVMTSGIYLNEYIDWVNDYSLIEGVEAYVVDLRGIVIAHSGVDLFTLEEGPLSLNYTDRPWVQDFIEGKPVSQSEYSLDGEQYYASLITVDHVGWGVFVELSTQHVLARTNALSGQLLTLNVLLFIIALPSSLIFTRQITIKQNRMDDELRSHNERLEELLEERTRAAAQLQLSEDQNRLLVEGSKDYAIFMLSPEGLISTWNQGAENIKGYTADEVTGKHYSLFYIEEDVRTGKPEQQLKIAREEGRYEDEGLRIRKDGTRFWANVIITALYDDAGVHSGFSKVTRDITERMKAEAEKDQLLQDNVERLKELDCLYGISNILELKLSLNETLDGIVKLLPPAWQYPEAACARIMYSDQTHVTENFDDTPWVQSADLNINGENVGSVEVRYLKEMPESFEGPFLKEERNMINDVAEHLSRFIEQRLMERDLQERDLKLEEYAQNLEKMVDEKTEELVKAERFAAIGRIASIIGHELRNPLAVIKNSIFFLNMKLEKDAENSIIRNMKLIDKEVNRSNIIISDLLDFARGPKQPLIQPVDLNKLVQEAIARIDIPEGVEVETSPEEVLSTKADPDMILRAFLNIISNAVDAMPKGGILTVETKTNNGDIVISIRDTGVGIPEENMEKLFTPLFSTKAKGVGLGLYITKSLVEAHDGTISVESVEGEGTTFTITLPLEEAE